VHFGVALISLLKNRKPGLLGQFRDDRLCHRSNLFMVSGVSPAAGHGAASLIELETEFACEGKLQTTSSK